MDTKDLGQVSRSAADIYEEFFVPALFAEWADRVCDAARVGAGDAVLDVACGTGVLTRAAATRVGFGGAVTGLDRNDGMLAVARRMAPGLDWRLGTAEALPFPDASFDAVVSQFGLMFFEDRVAALAEMHRVLRPGGRTAVAVWNSLDATPGYGAMTGLLEKLFGSEIANALKAPYVLGDPEMLRRLFSEAGMAGAQVRVVAGQARFPSIESWVHTDIKGWTLADRIDDAQYKRLLTAARTELARFTDADGRVSFDHPAVIVTATGA